MGDGTISKALYGVRVAVLEDSLHLSIPYDDRLVCTARCKPGSCTQRQVEIMNGVLQYNNAFIAFIRSLSY